jgi:acyl transferase domain-containing protein
MGPYRYVLVPVIALGAALNNVPEELSKDKDHTKVNEPDYSQTLCTILQVALVDIMDSFGVKPAAVVGHSSGEIAAA